MELRDRLQSSLGNAYTLERELAGGGMSRVFVAEEARLGRKVVVKVLPPELAADINIERFEREIKLAASLQQANIVPVLSAGDIGGVPYYTMPFVEGEGLRERLRNHGPMSIGVAVGVLRDVARALAYAHERGIVHRDIKPDNVLLSGGAAVVTDFGIAKAISASRTHSDRATLTQSGTAVGTPAYISPEQAAGDPAVDHRADIYSFGCMAYEMLTGQPPFANRAPQRLMAAHISEKPQQILEVRSDAPPALAAVVMRCLEKDPLARPQAATELLVALDAAAMSDPGQAAIPAILLAGRPMLWKALAVYVGAFVAVAILAKVAITGIGVPDWVFPGALIVAALGLPVILFTGYVQYATRRAHAGSPGPLADQRGDGIVATLAVAVGPHVNWRRTALGGVYAFGTFVLFVSAFMTLRVLGVGPSASLQAAGRLREREPLLIADFRATGVDQSIANAASEAIRADLAGSAAITVVSQTSVGDALRRMQRTVPGQLDLPLARELAARLGVRAIVDGSVTALGSGVLVTVRLVSADSANELVAFHTTARALTDLIPAVDGLSRHLRGKIGESLRAVNRSPPLAQVTTTSLDALRLYTAGVRANNLEGNFPKAIQLLRDAVALDSTFAAAWTKLGVVTVNAGLSQAVTDSALVRAFQFRNRLPASERIRAEAYFYYRGPGHDRAKAITAYETGLLGGDSGLLNNLALLYASRREFARAESLLVAAIRLIPNSSLSHYQIVVVQANRGQLAEAQASLVRARDRFPTSPFSKPIETRLLYLRGEWGRYKAELDSLRRSQNLEVRSFALRSLAAFAKTSGRIAEFERLTLERRAADSARGSPVPAIVDSAAIIIDDAWFRNKPTEAVRRLDAMLAKVPLRSLPDLDRPYLDVAIAYAIAGSPDRSRAILAQFKEDLRDTAQVRDREPEVRRVQAEIALAESRPLEAIAEFRRASARPDGPASACLICLYAALGRAFDLANQPDSAIAMLEKYVATPYFYRAYDTDPVFLQPVYRETSYTSRFADTDPAFLAPAYLRLGELYEAKGDRTRSAYYYTKFAELWKDADADLQPKVSDVRRRLARLRDAQPR